MTDSGQQQSQPTLIMVNQDGYERRNWQPNSLSSNDNHIMFDDSKITSTDQTKSARSTAVSKQDQYSHSNYYHNQQDDEQSRDQDSDESPNEALLAVASAEEYAAKIIKLQQACLLPLKEDLADWLNKIMNVSTITKENFMDKLDNGVVICRLAKVISNWCYQQQLGNNQQQPQRELSQARNTKHSHNQTQPHLYGQQSSTMNDKEDMLSLSTLEVSKCLISSSL